MTIDELKVIITADTSALKSGVKEATNEVEKMSSTIQKKTSNLFGDQSSNGFSSLTESAREASNGITQSFGEVKGALAGYDSEVQSVASKTGNAMATIFPKEVGKSFSNILSKIASSWSLVSSSAKAVSSSVKEKFVKSFADIGQSAKDTTQAVKTNINNAISAENLFFNKLKEKVDEHKKQLENLQKDLREVSDKGGGLKPNATDEQKDQYYDSLKGIVKESSIVNHLTAKLKGMGTSGKEASDGLEDVAKGASEAGTAAKVASGGIGAFLAKIASIIPYASIIAIALGALLATIKSVSSVISLTDNIIKKSLKTVSQMVIQTNVLGLGIKKLGVVLEDVRRRLYRTFISTPISSVLSSIRSEISSLIQTNSSLGKSLGSLKGAFITAITPILGTVIPVLNSLIIAFTKVMSVIASLTSMLFGSTISASVSSAKSMNDQAKAIGGVSKAAKEATKSLMAFDEINKLNENTDTDSGGGAGASFGETNFDNIKVPDYKSIKEAFSDLLDYLISKLPSLETAMQTAAVGINEFFRQLNEAFSDSSIISKVETLSSELARIFNNFVADINFTTIGNAIGNGLNLILISVNTFFEKFDFVQLGKQFANGINGIFSSINWQELGTNLVVGFNAVVQFISGAIAVIDWTGIGLGISTALNQAIRDMDSDSLATAFSDGINGIIELGFALLENTNVEEFTEKFVGLFNTVNWGEVGDKVSKLVIKALKVIGPAIGEMRKAVQEAIIKLVKSLDAEELGHSVAQFLKDADILGTIGRSLEIIGTIVWDALVALLTVVGDWFVDLITPIADFFTNVDKTINDTIDQWHNDLVEWMGNLFTKIGQWLSETWDSIKKWFTDLINNIVQWFKNIFKNISDAWNNIKTNTTNVWENIKGIISQKVVNILNVFKTKFNEAKTNISSIFNSIKTTISNIMSGIFNTISGWVSNIVSKISEIWNAITGAEKGAEKAIEKPTKNNSNVVVTVNQPNRRYTGQQMASGGFVDQGQLFIAREAGPELVGSIGNKTAVANNEQIIQGIKQGVKEALLEAGSGNNSGDINLYLDSTLVAKKVIKYHNDVVKQTGLSPLMV